MEERRTELQGDFPQTAEFQRKYMTLVSLCEELGSMVRQDSEIEADKDAAPHTFFRKGRIEYIFPPQPAEPELLNKRTLDDTPGYELVENIEEYRFDPAFVQGRVTLDYQDADNNPRLHLSWEGKIPGQLEKTIKDIFQEHAKDKPL